MVPAASRSPFFGAMENPEEVLQGLQGLEDVSRRQQQQAPPSPQRLPIQAQPQPQQPHDQLPPHVAAPPPHVHSPNQAHHQHPRPARAIPRALDDYLAWVARTGEPLYPWPLLRALLKEKLAAVVDEFRELETAAAAGATAATVAPPPASANAPAFDCDAMRACFLARLDSFAQPPFTVQRICELLAQPRRHYARLDKFMRAFEKNVLVVSAKEPEPFARRPLGGGAATTTNSTSPASVAVSSQQQPQRHLDQDHSDPDVDVDMDDPADGMATADPIENSPQPMEEAAFVANDVHHEPAPEAPIEPEAAPVPSPPERVAEPMDSIETESAPSPPPALATEAPPSDAPPPAEESPNSNFANFESSSSADEEEPKVETTDAINPILEEAPPALEEPTAQEERHEEPVEARFSPEPEETATGASLDDGEKETPPSVQGETIETPSSEISPEPEATPE